MIPLFKQRFASCSWDRTGRIWKDNNTYDCLSTLKHDGWVESILQWRGKEVLVSCGYESSTGVFFWNLNDYSKQHTIKRYGVTNSTHMIELFDGTLFCFLEKNLFLSLSLIVHHIKQRKRFYWKNISLNILLYVRLMNIHSFMLEMVYSSKYQMKTVQCCFN